MPTPQRFALSSLPRNVALWQLLTLTTSLPGKPAKLLTIAGASLNERYRPSGRHPREFSSRHALPVRSDWQAHEGGSGGGSGGGDGVGDGDGNAGGDGGSGGGAGGDGGEAGDRSAWSALFTAAAAPASSAASSAALPFSSASAAASPVGSAVAILATRRRSSADLTGRISASALRVPAGDWWPRPINSSAAAANSRAAARRDLVAIMCRH